MLRETGRIDASLWLIILKRFVPRFPETELAHALFFLGILSTHRYYTALMHCTDNNI